MPGRVSDGIISGCGLLLIVINSYGPSTESLQKKLLGHSDVFYGGQSYSGRGAGGAAGKNKGSREKGMQQRMFAPGVRKELKEVEELLGTPVSDLGIERKTAGDDILLVM